MLRFIRCDKSLIFVTVCFGFYISAVFCLPFRANLEIFTTITVGTIFGLSFAYQKLKNFTIKPQKHESIPFWYFFSIASAVLAFYLYATWPGHISPDTICQWSEIQKGQFTDWHPAIHTLLVGMFAKICNNFTFVLVCQMIIFNLINSSLFYKLSKQGFPKKLIWIAFFITTLSPATTMHMLTLWKDAAFAIMILGLTEILVLTYLSNGEWIKSNSKIVLMGTILGLATLVRHNGILFTLPFFVAFSYLFFSKYIIKLTFITFATILFVKFPLYSHFKVSPHPQAQAEMCGLPMTVLSEIFVKNPSVIDNETADFLLSINNYDTWKTRYVSGSWNSVKYLSIDKNHCTILANKRIEEFSPQKICFKALKHGILDPENALNALVNLTGLVWRVTIFSDGLSPLYPINSLNTSDYLITVKKDLSEKSSASSNKNFLGNPTVKLADLNSIFRGILQMAITFYSVVLGNFFQPGIYLMILLLTAFFSFHRLRWKAFLIISPILVYNFGTMLLLCGPNDFRFFFFNILITFPYMFMLLADKSFRRNFRKENSVQR